MVDKPLPLGRGQSAGDPCPGELEHLVESPAHFARCEREDAVVPRAEDLRPTRAEDRAHGRALVLVDRDERRPTARVPDADRAIEPRGHDTLAAWVEGRRFDRSLMATEHGEGLPVETPDAGSCVVPGTDDARVVGTERGGVDRPEVPPEGGDPRPRWTGTGKLDHAVGSGAEHSPIVGTELDVADRSAMPRDDDLRRVVDAPQNYMTVLPTARDSPGRVIKARRKDGTAVVCENALLSPVRSRPYLDGSVVRRGDDVASVVGEAREAWRLVGMPLSAQSAACRIPDPDRRGRASGDDAVTVGAKRRRRDRRFSAPVHGPADHARRPGIPRPDRAIRAGAHDHVAVRTETHVTDPSALPAQDGSHIAPGGVDHPDRPVFARSRNPSAIGTERRGAQDLVVDAESELPCTRAEIPEVHPP